MARKKELDTFAGRMAHLAAEAGLKKGERTRRQLKVAAAQCLETTPVGQLNMDQVAAEAGVSRPTIYQYFRSIDEIVTEVLGEFRTMTLETLSQAAGGDTVEESIFLTHYAYVLHYANNAALMERVRELMSIAPDMLLERQRINALWTRRILTRIRASTECAESEQALELRIHCLGSMVDDVLREAFVVRNPAFALACKDAKAFAQELTAIWQRVLLPVAHQGGDARARVGKARSKRPRDPDGAVDAAS
ncbi:TetR/AcrR family transcriptional regulator [Paraburkholderia sp. ZP32-5]|uniref:TetR/AcrR family transcriptional regulator n=1 Tax=Paraburkholderia sp. ZP32-5 TaxID=2883245 RepID=UPI001F19B3A5|nr:TetR/AcrR family transcriptional regulator [Paraburkholderia sp. ZP32-5]